MATVKKANRLLTIKDEEVESYLGMGYDQIDDQGEVIVPGEFVSTDKAATAKVSKLNVENKALKKENAELAELNAKLTAQIAELTKTPIGAGTAPQG